MHAGASHSHAKQGPSLLELVAAHEAGLDTKVAAAAAASREIVDAAYTEASAFLTEDYAQLEREVSELRRSAAEARETNVTAIKAACDSKVAGIRQGADAKLEQVFQEAVRRVLPRA